MSVGNLMALDELGGFRSIRNFSDTSPSSHSVFLSKFPRFFFFFFGLFCGQLFDYQTYTQPRLEKILNFVHNIMEK